MFNKLFKIFQFLQTFIRLIRTLYIRKQRTQIITQRSQWISPFWILSDQSVGSVRNKRNAPFAKNPASFIVRKKSPMGGGLRRVPNLGIINGNISNTVWKWITNFVSDFRSDLDLGSKFDFFISWGTKLIFLKKLTTNQDKRVL